MALDLARMMARKQERECARLDEFDFRQRARAVRLLAEWVRGQAAEPGSIDPVDLASQVARRSFESLAAELRAHVPTVAERIWQRHVQHCFDEARRTLIAEHGDPTPHRLA